MKFTVGVSSCMQGFEISSVGCISSSGLASVGPCVPGNAIVSTLDSQRKLPLQASQ